jgi:hypothetical protein
MHAASTHPIVLIAFVISQIIIISPDAYVRRGAFIYPGPASTKGVDPSEGCGQRRSVRDPRNGPRGWRAAAAQAGNAGSHAAAAHIHYFIGRISRANANSRSAASFSAWFGLHGRMSERAAVAHFLNGFALKSCTMASGPTPSAT